MGLTGIGFVRTFVVFLPPRGKNSLMQLQNVPYGWVQHETLWENNTIPFCWIYHFLIESVQQKTTDKQLLEQV